MADIELAQTDDHHHHLGEDDHSHDHEGHDALTLDEIKTFKIVFIFVYLAITYLGLLPRVLGSCRQNKAALSFMNCFAGGVFLAIGLIHLVPEGSGQFEEWTSEQGIDEAFPLFYTLTFVGYLIALMVDRVIFNKGQKQAGHNHGTPADNASAASADKPNYEPAVNDSNRVEIKPLEIESGASKDKTTEPAADHVWNSSASAICVAVALAFQVFKEGVGFGGEVEIESGYQVGSALFINVATISLSLGSAFTKAGWTTRQVLLGLTIFTFIGPLALIIGMAAESALPAIWNVILLSLATGIYIYFACSEVFVKEFANGEGVLSKIIAITIGVLIILGLVFIESGHDHGNENVLAEVCGAISEHGHDH